MTVSELIVHLQTFPPTMEVAHYFCSEACLIEASEIAIATACLPRGDGWIQNKRPDMESKEYVMFPGH